MAFNRKKQKLQQPPVPFAVRPPKGVDRRFDRNGGNNGKWSEPKVRVTADDARGFFQNNIFFGRVPNLSNNLLERLERDIISAHGGWEMVKGTGTDQVATQAHRTRALAHLTHATSFDCLQRGYFVQRVNNWRLATTRQKESPIGQLALELEKSEFVEGVRKTMQVCVLTLD